MDIALSAVLDASERCPCIGSKPQAGIVSAMAKALAVSTLRRRALLVNDVDDTVGYINDLLYLVAVKRSSDCR